MKIVIIDGKEMQIMKKILSLAMVCLLMMSLMVMAVLPASAASAQDDIVAALKERVPAEYLNQYLPAVENILQQLEITDEQADQIIACIAATDDAMADYHYSLHLFTAEERAAALKQLDAVCDILNVRYELKLSQDSDHNNDQVAVFYKADGTKLADVDFDVKKTNTPSQMSVEYIVLAVVFAIGAIVTAVYGKKAVSAR